MTSNQIFSLCIVGGFILIGIIIVAACGASNDKRIDWLKRAEHIVKTKMVDKHETSTSTTKASTGSAIARGVVGSAVAGPIGGLAGAATAKSSTVTNTEVEYTFKVWWDDNTETIEKCKYNDYKYQKFIEKIDI